MIFNSPMYAFRSTHPNGANFVFCDASVKFLSESIDMTVLQGGSEETGWGRGDQQTIFDACRGYFLLLTRSPPHAFSRLSAWFRIVSGTCRL